MMDAFSTMVRTTKAELAEAIAPLPGEIKAVITAALALAADDASVMVRASFVGEGTTKQLNLMVRTWAS